MRRGLRAGGVAAAIPASEDDAFSTLDVSSEGATGEVESVASGWIVSIGAGVSHDGSGAGAQSVPSLAPEDGASSC